MASEFFFQILGATISVAPGFFQMPGSAISIHSETPKICSHRAVAVIRGWLEEPESEFPAGFGRKFSP